jgi:predicted NAD/FAD-binding protein
LSTPVTSLSRHPDGVELRLADGGSAGFDRAVVATHGDEALALLADPTRDERRILGAFTTTRNETVLHSDERFLPRAPTARASWNFHLNDCSSPAEQPTMTYYLNRLQRLPGPQHYCVTLNRSDEIREESVIERIVYHHPLYTRESLRAQAELPKLNTGPMAFCGAYHGYGFHEDGLRSGIAAAESLGVRW